MSLQQDKAPIDKEQEKETRRYLRDNPAFFERHLDLLADMVLPHDSGNAVSLVERQMAILREQKNEHKEKLQFLIANAQQNEQLVNKLNQLILDMMDAPSLKALITLTEQRLSTDFSADMVVIRLLNSGVEDTASWSSEALSAFEQVASKCQSVCGPLSDAHTQALFGDAAEHIKSVALLPLLNVGDNKICEGLIAIGSKDGQRFTKGMDTLFLAHLAKVLTRVINLHLKG